MYEYECEILHVQCLPHKMKNKKEEFCNRMKRKH